MFAFIAVIFYLSGGLLVAMSYTHPAPWIAPAAIILFMLAATQFCSAIDAWLTQRREGAP
jgi:hypothetical protein